MVNTPANTSWGESVAICCLVFCETLPIPPGAISLHAKVFIYAASIIVISLFLYPHLYPNSMLRETEKTTLVAVHQSKDGDTTFCGYGDNFELEGNLSQAGDINMTKTFMRGSGQVSLFRRELVSPLDPSTANFGVCLSSHSQLSLCFSDIVAVLLI